MPTIEQARAWYPSNDPVHGFDHILRVERMALRIAQAEGADVRIVSAAALLHDVGGAQRHSHQASAADFAGQVLLQEGWDAADIQAVQHCIRAHRFRDDTEQPQTLEAQVLFDADKLDAIGATGVARAVAYAANAGMQAFIQPSQSFLDGGQMAPGELHSAYHEYLFKLRKLKERMYTRTGRELAEARHRVMADFFDQLQAEAGGER